MAHTTAAQRILHAPEGLTSAADELWSLLDRHRPELVNQALALVGDLADAEDAVQETFCEALRRPERMREAQSLGAWLRTANRANALDLLRRKRTRARSAEASARELPPRLVTTGGFSLVEAREALAKAIESLPREMRATVVLRYWAGLACDEIARRQGLPPGTVRWQLCEAARLLHQKLRVFFEASPGTAGPTEPNESKEG